MNLIISPTHTCFDDALDLLVALLRQNQGRRRTLRLVHGIVLAGGSRLWAHAWLQEGDTVFFSGIVDGEKSYFQGSRAEYYAEIQVQEHTSYTVAMALEHNRTSGHYGPWKARYLALCGHGGRRRRA